VIFGVSLECALSYINGIGGDFSYVINKVWSVNLCSVSESYVIPYLLSRDRIRSMHDRSSPL
jgi:hypothetical protein